MVMGSIPFVDACNAQVIERDVIKQNSRVSEKYRWRMELIAGAYRRQR
jgi:hypothetical protein